MNDSELRSIIGAVAFDEYIDATERGKEEVRELAGQIQKMSNHEFVRTASSAILESARMSSFRGNFNGLHAQASACYMESERRFRENGHSQECTGDSLYDRAFRYARQSQGYTSRPGRVCDCGAV